MKIPALNKKTYHFAIEIMIDIICIFCLSRMLSYLCFMENTLYQTHKNTQAAHAFLYLAIFMFITQRVRLINWQSLIASLIYLPVGYLYQTRYIEAPDLYNRDKIVVWIIWLILLIIVDMAVYKKVNPLQNFHPIALSIFAAMTVFMIFYRNGRTSPIILVLAFIFYLIPMDEAKWSRVANQFCISWIVAFYYMLYRSLKYNPEVNSKIGRWYGDFLNIGDFGIFIACTAAVILYKMYQSRKQYGRKSIPYAIYSLSLLPLIWTAFRVSTITMFIGIGFIFLIGFILLHKNMSRKTVLCRLGIVLVGIPILILLALLILKGLSYTDKAYWKQVLVEGNTFLKPLANLIGRAHKMFTGSKTYSNSNVFEPNTLINTLDLFTSGRLSICKLFAEQFTHAGSPSYGIQVGTYYAYNAHNTYVQVLYEYGYTGGGLYILWFLYSTGAGMAQYIKEKALVRLLPCLWLAMALGVQLGEARGLYSPLLVMTLIIIYPIIVNINKAKETALE